jgi:ribonuclease Y
MIELIIALISLAAGSAAGFFYKSVSAKNQLKEIEFSNRELTSSLEKEKQSYKKSLELEFKEKLINERNNLENKFKSVREELNKLDKELTIKNEKLDSFSKELNEKNRKLDDKLKEVSNKENRINEALNKQIKELERISGLSAQEAKLNLVKTIEKDAKQDALKYIKKYEEEAKKVAESEAKKIVTMAIQRCAADIVAENSITSVTLASDDMKGRIIGREGRNIREFEKCTGVDLIIDDTPEIVIISSFDSIRREVARIALEKLLADGRIHPTRIEEIVDKTKKELSKTIVETGENAVLQVGVHGISEEEIKYLGKLRYRTSYGQNVLQHSIEVANLAGIMAAELGANVQLAKKMGLLHDIGKALDQENEGTHAKLGAELLKKTGEPDVVVHAVAAHHGEVGFKTVEGVLIAAADAVSAARPGARKENVESYIKRLQELEQIATDKEHVEKAYALQAGREIRVIVKPENITDEHMEVLARDIAKEVEEKLEYPGQIKITLIRESRVVSYAK